MKIAILAVFLAGPARAAGAGYADYTLKEGRFSCQIPKAWGQRREPGVEQKEKAYGIFLTGPRSAEGASAQIDIRWYAPGNIVFPKAEDFLKAGTAGSVIPRKGEKPPVVEKTTVAGLPAKKFAKKSFEYIPPNSMDTKKIPMTEETVLVEAKEGFYTLSYSAPESIDSQQRPVFRKVLKSFHPIQ